MGFLTSDRNFRHPISAIAMRICSFPLADTIYSNDAMELIGCGFYTLTRLIDEGCILAYRLAPGARTPWRISRISVTLHMQRALTGVVGGPNKYRMVEQ